MPRSVNQHAAPRHSERERCILLAAVVLRVRWVNIEMFRYCTGNALGLLLLADRLNWPDLLRRL